jgi:hypothetical protein
MVDRLIGKKKARATRQATEKTPVQAEPAQEEASEEEAGHRDMGREWSAGDACKLFE